MYIEYGCQYGWIPIGIKLTKGIAGKEAEDKSEIDEDGTIYIHRIEKTIEKKYFIILVC